jgi:hypothetical protein
MTAHTSAAVMLRVGETKKAYGRLAEKHNRKERSIQNTQKTGWNQKTPGDHHDRKDLHDHVPKIEYLLNSHEIDRRFRTALRVHHASENVLAFYLAEIDRRRLWKELGYSSAFHYAKTVTGFGDRKIRYLIHIGKKLEELRLLRRAFVDGRISWTKAREILRAATPGTEQQWIEFGMSKSCREIREMVSQVNRIIKKDALHSDSIRQQDGRTKVCSLSDSSMCAPGCTPSEPAICAHVCTQSTSICNAPKEERSNSGNTAPGCTQSNSTFPVSGSPRSDSSLCAHVCTDPISIQNIPADEHSNSTMTAHVCRNTNSIQNAPVGNLSRGSNRAHVCTKGTPEDCSNGSGHMNRNREKGKANGRAMADDSNEDNHSGGIAQMLTGNNPSQRRIAMTFSFSPEEYQIVMQALKEWKRHNPQERKRERFFVAMSQKLLEENGRSGAERISKKHGHEKRGKGELQEDAGSNDERTCTKLYDSPYQVVIHHCESCGKNRIHTDRGAIEIDRSLFERALCDGKVVKIIDAGNGENGNGKKGLMGRNRRSVSAALRQKILLRDKHTCQVPGCTHSQFLEVHHIIPRHSMHAWHRGKSVDGQKKSKIEVHSRRNAKTSHLTQDCTHREEREINAPANMVSVCSRCHRLIHEGKIVAKGAFPDVKWFHEKGIPFE